MFFNFNKSTIKSLEAKELINMLKSDEKITIIDVCENWEYNHKHIDNSTNIPLGTLNYSFDIEFDGLSTDTKIVVYCAHGVRSKQALRILENKGFNNVYSLKGGMQAYLWEQSANG